MENIIETARIIVDNLTPLLGCRHKHKRWSPRVGSEVCKNLDISSLLCLDMEKEKYQKGYIKYTFDNKISIKSSNIYKLARMYSPLVLDTSYNIQVQNGNAELMNINEQLFFQSLSKRYNDSAIMDILEVQKGFKLSPVYKHLLLVMLECFSIRFTLYEFVYNDVPLEYTEINSKQLKKVINNLIFVRVKLEEFDTKETIELNHHLSTLLLNLELIERNISRRFIKI